MAAPSHKMVAETFQTGLRPRKSGQCRRRFQSASQRCLKPSQPPTHRPAHTWGLSRTPSYTHRTLGSVRHKCCREALCSQLGILLPGAPQGHSRHRNLRWRLPLDQSRTGLSHNPRTTLLPKRVLHAGSSPALSTAHWCTSNTSSSPPATNVQHEQRQCFRRRPPHPPQDAPAQGTTPELPTSSTPRRATAAPVPAQGSPKSAVLPRGTP